MVLIDRLIKYLFSWMLFSLLEDLSELCSSLFDRLQFGGISGLFTFILGSVFVIIIGLFVDTTSIKFRIIYFFLDPRG